MATLIQLDSSLRVNSLLQKQDSPTDWYRPCFEQTESELPLIYLPKGCSARLEITPIPGSFLPYLVLGISDWRSRNGKTPHTQIRQLMDTNHTFEDIQRVYEGSGVVDLNVFTNPLSEKRGSIGLLWRAEEPKALLELVDPSVQVLLDQLITISTMRNSNF